MQGPGLVFLDVLASARLGKGAKCHPVAADQSDQSDCVGYAGSSQKVVFVPAVMGYKMSTAVQACALDSAVSAEALETSSFALRPSSCAMEQG